jgi:hypothetical protein
MRRPSPALVVSVVALVFAAAGTSVAAIDYARNAGAVDGKSAVASSSTRVHAAGRLVATASEGALKGRIPAKFLDLSGAVAGGQTTFGRAFDVIDNQSAAPVAVGSVPGLGTITASCNDQSPRPGVEDPTTTIAFANASGAPVNLARTVGNGDTFIAPLQNGAQHAFTISGSNTFRVHVELRGRNFVAEGVVRQDGRGSAAATCLVYGYALSLPPAS